MHSIKLDLLQKGFDDFNDDTFNKMESLKKEFSEKEESKRENLEKLNEVVGLFKESIDKVFDRVSAFTFEKYKEENDDGEDDEQNYREFEEIKKMILECRDFYKRYMEDRRAELNPKAFNRCKEQVCECNDLLKLDYSSKNLKQLKQFKNGVYNGTYQEDFQKWRRSKR
ncbi:hypothetical protein BTM444_13640 [Helicobacter pylori]